MRDVLVLGTGSGNDVPLVRRLARRGWRVHLGCTVDTIYQHARSLESGFRLGADATRWTDELLAWAAKRPQQDGGQRPVLLPTVDAGIARILADWDRLAEVFSITLPGPGPTHELFLKDRLYANCKAAGIPHTETLAELQSGEAAGDPPDLQWPVVLKPASPKQQMTRGQQDKVLVLRSPEDWREFASAREVETHVVVGRAVDYRAKVLCAGFVATDGRLVFHNTFHLSLTHPQHDGNAVWCRPCDDSACGTPTFSERLQALCAAAGYHGFVEAEFLRDEADGSYLLIDVQCRPTLQNAALFARGLDVDAAVRHLADDKALATLPQGGPKHWIDLPRLMARTRTAEEPLMRRLASFGGALLRLATRRAVEATFSWREPKPWLRTLWWAVRGVG